MIKALHFAIKYAVVPLYIVVFASSQALKRAHKP